MSSPAPLGQPIVTADDHGAIVSIAIYFLMTTFIVAVLIRLVIRLAITRSLGRDDYIVVGATVSHVAQDMSTTPNWSFTVSRCWANHCLDERRSRWPGEEGRPAQ
jgi:hypothetical protein